MKHIDLGTGTLANRAQADVALEALRTRGGTGGLLLDFNENIATMSWLDGYLTPIVSDETNGAIFVLCSSEGAREHISATLLRRGLAVLAAENTDQFMAGRFQVLGDITAEQRDAFEAVAAYGSARVADVAEMLDLSIEATQQRLSDLLQKRLLDREKSGRAYRYFVPTATGAELSAT